MIARGCRVVQPAVEQLWGSVVLPPELPQADKNNSRARLMAANSRFEHTINPFMTRYL
jgi:hypothetical protein